MTVEMAADVRARLDAHLDAVEEALRASGRTREQRRGIVDDLEAQILDMLAGRSAAPSTADLEAVLATVDPPAAYRETAAGSPGMPASPAQRPVNPVPVPLPPQRLQPRYSRPAIWGFVLLVVSMAPVLLGVSVGIYATNAMHNDFVMPFTREERHMFVSNLMSGLIPLLAVVAVPLALAGTVLGWVGFFQVRASRGAVRGMGLALFDGAFYPLLVMGVLMLRLIFGP
jgi:hypothetical protein